MKYLLVVLLAISPITDIDKIAKVNAIKKEAKSAFNKGDYQIAIDKYNYLLDSMEVVDENITLNLANAYYQLKDSASLAQANNNYSSLLDSKDGVIKSVAHQQLGIMADRNKKFEVALEHFKNAIRANPNNDDARYNYEMLKKMLDKKKEEEQQNKDKQDQKKENEQNKDQQNKDQQNQDQENKEGENKEDKEQQQQEQQNKEGEQSEEEKQQEQQNQKEGEEGEEKEQPQPQESEQNEEQKAKEEQMQSLSDKLKEMKISEEKAKMILEALKNNEIQYIQQNKRKPTKRKDPSKPDW